VEDDGVVAVTLTESAGTKAAKVSIVEMTDVPVFPDDSQSVLFGQTANLGWIGLGISTHRWISWIRR